MAVIGEAYVVIRAATNRMLPEIERKLQGLRGIGNSAGNDLARGIQEGLSGGNASSWFDEFRERVEASRVQLRQFSNLFRFLGPLIFGLVGAIGALAGGLVVFVAAVGNAARTSIVLVAALGSLATALVVTRGLLGGISEAYKAKANAQGASASSNRAEEAALRRLEQARLRLKRLIEEEAPEELAKARERAADAARAAADAILSAERTQRSFNDAQRETLAATEDLNRARDRAREKLKQLRFELEGAAIGEKRARLEFEKARDSLQAVQDLPPNSRARQEAELAFAQAELNLRKAIDSNQQLRKEESSATQAGVEGSKDVIDAKDRIAKAQQREADLAIDTARAFERAARAQRDAAQAAADAAAGGRVERELNRRIAEARQAVIDAEKDLAEARKSAAGSNALADAYKNLNEAGITLVQTLDRLRKLFIEFRKATSTPFLTLLNEALLILEANLFNFADVVEETGRIVGQLALNFAEAFLQGEGADRLRKVWGTNNILLERLGNAALNLAQAFLIILEAAEPLIDTFGKWVESKSANFLEKLAKDGGELSQKFENAQRNASLLGTLLGNIFRGFGTIGKVINEEGGAAQILLEGLITRSGDWADRLDELAKNGELSQYFKDLSNNFLELVDVVTTLGGAILEIGRQEGIGQFLGSIRESIVIFKDIGVELSGPDGPVAKLGEFVVLFAEFTAALTDSGALNAFFDTLNAIFTPIVEFVKSEAFQEFFQEFGPIIAQAAAIGFAFRSARFAVEALIGTLLLLVLPIASVTSKVTGFGQAITAPGITLAKAIPMVLRFLGIVGLIVTVLIGVWTQSEAFRTSIGALFGAVFGALQGAIADIDRIIQRIFPGISGAGELIGLIFKGIGDFLSVTLIPLIGFVITRAIGLVAGFVQRFLLIIEAIKNAVMFVINFIIGLWKLLTGDLEGATESWGKAFENFKDTAIAVFKAIIAPAVGMFNGVADAWNRTVANFVIKIPDWVPFIGGKTFQLPQIPRVNLAKGGIVPATPGGILATIGEAGRPERVEPLDPDGLSKRDKAMIDRLSGGGKTTINVYPSAGMNEEELAAMVSRKLASQMRRGSI